MLVFFGLHKIGFWPEFCYFWWGLGNYKKTTENNGYPFMPSIRSAQTDSPALVAIKIKMRKKYTIIKVDKFAGKIPEDSYKLKNIPYLIVMEKHREFIKEIVGSNRSDKEVLFSGRSNTYINLMRALDDYISLGIRVVNLSLLVKTQLDDPIHKLIEKCIENRISIIVAAGNKGPKENSINPIGMIRGVISVGAIDDDGKVIARSSRGIKGKFGPTVVANGCSNIPKELLNTKPIYYYSPPSTSYAAPKITRCVSAIIVMIRVLENIINATTNSSLKPVELPPIYAPDTGGEIDFDLYPPYVKKMVEENRFYLDVRPNIEEKKWMRVALDFIIEYVRPLIYITDRPYFIKMIIEKIARKEKSQMIHEVGAGKVTIDSVIAFFSKFSLLDLIWFFNHGDQGLINTLMFDTKLINKDRSLGKLFDNKIVSEICIIAHNVVIHPSKIVV